MEPNQSTLPHPQNRKSVKTKIGQMTISQKLDQDLIEQEFSLLLRGEKPKSDHTEEFKYAPESVEPDFSRQSDLDLGSGRKNEEQKTSSPRPHEQHHGLSGGGTIHIDQFSKTLSKQDAQKLQQQLDIIEEEVEENLDTKFQGFNAVKQKIESKAPFQKDNATLVSGLIGNVTGRANFGADMLSQAKGGMSRIDQQSVIESQMPYQFAPRAAANQNLERKLSLAGPLLDQRSLGPQGIRPLQSESKFQSEFGYGQSGPDPKDLLNPFNENFLDNQLQMEKMELNFLGFQNLLFGDIITLRVDKQDKCFNLLSKKSISNKLTKLEYDDGEFDSRCLFRVIPQSQYQSQMRIRSIVDRETLPLNSIQRDYDSLIAEAEQNKQYQSQMMGTDLKYWIDVQIVHENSKRFLSADEFTLQQINSFYDPKVFLDTEIKAVTFATQVSKQTHFKLVPTCNFQSEGSGLISNGHYFYVLYLDREKNREYYLYDHAQAGAFILSETYKTAIRFSNVRESVSFEEERTLRNSSQVILTFANENYYLNLRSFKETEGSQLGGSQPNVKQVGDHKKAAAEVKQSEAGQDYYVELEKYDDIKSIDLSGFWVLELSTEREFRLRIKNQLTGLYLSSKTQNGGASLVLTRECDQDSDYELIPVNSRIESIQDLDKKVIFKLRTCPINIGEYQEAYYLRNIKSIKGNEHLGQTIQHIVSDEADNQRKSISLGKVCELNKFDTFKVVFPDDQEFLEIRFCVDTIQQLDNILQKLQKARQTSTLLQSQDELNVLATANYLISFIKFCSNNLQGLILPRKAKESSFVPYRQKLLSRIGALDFLFNYLDVLIDSKVRKPALTIQKRQEVKQWEHQIANFFKFRVRSEGTLGMDSLLDIIFECIYSIIKDQKSLRYLAAQRIDILQKFIFVERAPKILIEILKENLRVMTRKEIHAISDPIKIYQFQRYIPLLDFFIQSIDPKSRKSKLPYLMRKICIQDGFPLPLIQRYIYNRLFTENEGKGKTLEIQQSSSGFNIFDSATQVSYEFSDFRPGINIEFEEKHGRIREFALEQLDLMSELCEGRNNEVSESFRPKFPLELLLAIIRQELVPKMFRAKFLKLLLVLYIDCDPHRDYQYSRVVTLIDGDSRASQIND